MLSLWDYVSGAILVSLTCCLGIYHIFQAKKVKDAREFMFSNPDLGFCPLILSSVATFLSGILLTGFPAETYKDGGTYILISLSLLLLVPFITHFFLPVFFRLGCKTVFEYLELRFNRKIRVICSVMFCIQIILFTAVAIYAPSLALLQVTGLDFWTTVGTIGVVCIIYTTLGGIKAVIWADAAQAIVIISMLLIVIGKGCSDIGGISTVWQIASEGNRTDIFKFNDDGNSYYTFWTMGIGSTIHFLGFLGTNQMLMQRYLSNKTLKDARICFVGSMIGSSFVAGISSFCGLLIYAKYYQCDPLKSKMVTSTDQLMAYFAVDTLSFCSGLPGVFVAGILCATISTMSSCLNSVSAVFVEDYIRLFRPHMSDASAIRYSKMLGLLVGILCIAGVVVAQSVGGVMKAVLSMVGMVGGPVLAVFAIGMTFPWVNTLGASVGFATGLILTGWATIGSMMSDSGLSGSPLSTDGCPINSTFNLNYANGTDDFITKDILKPKTFELYTLSPLWYSSWSCLAMFTIGTIVSCVSGGQDPEKVDPQLIFPLMRKLIRALPRNIQTKLGFNPQSSVYCRPNQIEQFDDGRELQKVYLKRNPRTQKESDEAIEHTEAFTMLKPS